MTDTATHNGANCRVMGVFSKDTNSVTKRYFHYKNKGVILLLLESFATEE